MRYILTLVFISVVFFSCATAGSGRDHNKLTIDDAVALADKAVSDLGYDRGSMKMGIFIDHIPWFMRYPYTKSHVSDYTTKLKDVLSNKKYWAIYFLPAGHNWEDGDICVFVDKLSGKVITIYEGNKLGIYGLGN